MNSNGASNNVDSGSLASSSEIGLGTDFYAYPQPRTWTFGDPGRLVAAMITPRRLAMRIRFALAFALVGSLAGCNSLLDQSPVDQVPDDQAITNAEGARAALIGAYNALQLEPYYDRDFVDLRRPADRQRRSMSARSRRSRRPTPTSFGPTTPRSTTIWNSIYDGINRANVILLKVPPLTDLDDTEKNEILGEAHFLRALHYHNLVKLWGDVPIRLTPVTSPDEAADAVRSPVADVYAQIIADLTEAGTLITSTEPTTQANIGAVHALRARVALYQADYATALAEADAVIDQGYTLAPAYSDLFDPDGQDTPEDIFKVIFTPVQFNLEGFYYTSEDFDGRGEVAPTQELMDSYEPGDARLAWSITPDRGRRALGVQVAHHDRRRGHARHPASPRCS